MIVDIFLCPGELNPNDIRLTDPTKVAICGTIPQPITPGMDGGRIRQWQQQRPFWESREWIEKQNEDDLEIVEVLLMWLTRN